MKAAENRWNEKKTNDKTVDSANIAITTLNINGQAKMSSIDTKIY